MTLASFKIRNLTAGGAWSPSTDGGFDADPGDELELQLESSPAPAVDLTIFSCTDRSKGRSAPVFAPVSGQAATPTSAVTLTLPSTERGTWAIQCQVNGGGDGSIASIADTTTTRYVAVRTANLNLRHLLSGERTEYETDGWAVAIQELDDALDAFAAGAGTYTAGAGLNESPAGTFNIVAADGSITVNANSIQVGVVSDTQHGARGGGSLHSVATTLAAGFMSNTDKSKLDGVAAGAAALTSSAAANVGTGASAGTGTAAAREDHVHALTEAVLRTVLGTLTANPSFNSKKLTSIANGSASDDGAAFGQIASAVNAAVSGSANAIPKFTGTNAIGASGLTDDSTTVNTAEYFTVTKSGIGNTPTRAITIINATNSSTQWGGQYGWSAIAGGTQVNAGFQFEPQSSSRQIVRAVYGTGAGVPASSMGYFDNSDPNFGAGFGAPALWITSGGVGLRFQNSSNRGGWDQDGSNNNRGKSYSGAGFVYEMYSDAGSTLVATPISFAGTGKGRVVATPDVATSSGGVVTFRLNLSQNIRHTTTEDTTVTISGAVPGMKGTIDVIQGGTGRVVTMPLNGVGIEYDSSITSLGSPPGTNYQNFVIDQTANTRTTLDYYVTDSPATRLIITRRTVITIP